MGSPFYVVSGDGCSMLRCFCHCLLSMESSRVMHYSQILHSCVLLTLVFRPQSVHRKHIVAMPSGRLRVWREVYIHPNSTKLSFNHALTFSLASVCTLRCTPLLHVASLTGTWLTHEIYAAQRRFINLFDGNRRCSGLSVWSNRLGMTTEVMKVYVLSSMTFTSILNVIACRVMCIACSVVAEFFFLTTDYKWIHLCWGERRFNQQHLKYLMQRMF